MTDEHVLALVNEALRKVGEGRASLDSAGADLMRALIALPPRNPPAVNTGD